MYRYNRLIVGLSGSETDRSTLRWAAHVAEMAGSAEAHFVHVTPQLDYPIEALTESFGGVALTEHMREPVEEYVRDEAARAFGHLPEVERDVTTEEGSPLPELLRLARDREADLVIVGRRRHEAGTLPEKLARKAPCSVLVVPAEAPLRLRRILVAVDFSEYAALAVDVAAAFGEAAGVEEVIAHHAYCVPVGYYKTGKGYDAFARMMEGYAWDRFERFMEDLDTRGLPFRPLFALDDSPPEAIREAAEEQDVDLVVVGARGRSAGAAVLLGSVTERLIARLDVPIVAVKKKGENLSLLDALFQL